MLPSSWYDTDSFKHHWQGSDHFDQLKIFSFEMASWSNPWGDYVNVLTTRKFKYKDDQAEISNLKFQNVSYSQIDEALSPNVDNKSIVRYPLQIMDDLFTAQSFEETEADRNADGVVRKM